MIPILYEKDGATKKITLNDSLEAYVKEERNGDFELELTYPVVGDAYKNLDKEKIIVCNANDYLKNQLFRIYNIRKSMKNRVKVYAKHISFDLAHDWIDRISIENQSCEYALNTIFRNSQFCQHYKGYSDIVNAQNFKVNKVTCLKAIAGTSGSIIDTYGTGAEILRDNTNLHVLNRRGHDNDVVIEYRKNLTGLEVEEDTTDLVTRIMPYAIYTDEDSQEVEVRGDFVDSPLINNYAHPYVKYIDYSDKFENDEVPTKTKLNDLATKEYTVNKVDIPKCNYKIEFIPLSKCAGYEGLDDRINLCDVVTVKDTRYNIDTQAKVIKVTYNVLRDRYESMELGEPKTTLGDIIGGTGNGPMQGPPGPPGPQGPAGADGSIGDFPESLPSVPQITAKVYGFANIELSWTFENKVYYSYELYGSKTKGFAPNTFNLIFSGQASTYLYQAEPNETWYFRACAINTHGQRTEFSAEVKVNTVKISDLSNYVESAAIGDALIGELNLGRGWYGELRGNYIDARQLSVTNGNGKRTLDIDSFGNVSLDVASLKIQSSSVATEAFVSTVQEGINETVSNLNSRVDSAEQKVTDTAITNTVKQNFYTKEETENTINNKNFATSSQVQQTADNLTATFKSSGGCNLFRNSGFKCYEDKFRHWYGWNHQGLVTSGNYEINRASDDWGFPSWVTDSLVIHVVNPTNGTYVEYGMGQTVDTTAGQTYTVSCYYAMHRVTGANIVVRGDGGQWIATHSMDTSKSGGNGSVGNWGRASVTFVATSTTHSIEFMLNGVTDAGNGYLWIVQPMCNEGSVSLPYSAHPNESYDGIVSMDYQGINVATSYGAHTQFHAGGMSSYNNSNQRTLGIENGGISFHAWNNNALAAYITQSSLWGGNQSANGLAISTTANGTYLALGTSSLSDVNATLNMDQALTISANDSFQPIGINFWKDVHAHGYGIRQLSHLQLAGSGAIQFDYLNNSPSTIYEAVDNGHSLYVMGGYQLHLGCMAGTGTPKGMIWFKGQTDTHSYTHWDFHNYTMYNMKTASTYANYDTRRISESYGVTSNVDGVRYLYKNVELVNGKAIRSIPLEYKGCEYDVVSVVCKGRGNAWVETEGENRFEIQGDCLSVNVEIIIYPADDVMMLSTVNAIEAPVLELPEVATPEIAPQLTNEGVSSCDFWNQYMYSKYLFNLKKVTQMGGL